MVRSIQQSDYFRKEEVGVNKISYVYRHILKNNKQFTTCGEDKATSGC